MKTKDGVWSCIFYGVLKCYLALLFVWSTEIIGEHKNLGVCQGPSEDLKRHKSFTTWFRRGP